MFDPQWTCQNHVFKCTFNIKSSRLDVSALEQLCSNSPGGGDETNSNMTSRGSGVFVTLQAGNKMALSVSLA